jgi:hypothetical protein
MNPCPSARPGEGEQEQNRRGSLSAQSGSERSERRLGETDFVLAGGARAEPSHPRLQTKKMSRSDAVPAATIGTRKGGDAGTATPVAARLERHRAQRGAARNSLRNGRRKSMNHDLVVRMLTPTDCGLAILPLRFAEDLHSVCGEAA